MGGALLALETETELRGVRDVIVHTYGLPVSFEVWTGLNDLGVEDVYEWTGFNGTLEKSTRNMWCPNEPNSWTDTGDCGAFSLDEPGLKMLACNLNMFYMCEFTSELMNL
ncbi:collectin-11-like [Diadema antillarum]|uniref:collectin-11-like n=1 Tax=Diadema antillarum TaxID=105358 RepID=UPI003A862A95